MMNRMNPDCGAAMLALTLNAALAHGAAINGEVRKIDEGAGKITLSMVRPRASAWMSR